jgi:hypothetical protein
LRERLKRINAEVGRLVAAVAAGGELVPLMAALKARRGKVDALTRELERIADPPVRRDRRSTVHARLAHALGLEGSEHNCGMDRPRV